MKALIVVWGLALIAAPAFAKAAKPAAKSAHEWSMNGSVIEACSCPMFGSCWFGSGHPAGHYNAETHDEQHFCRFNDAIKVNQGHYKAVSLDGAKFWLSGDLGGDFSKGESEWAVLTFDKAVSAEQREGITAIVAKLFPLHWQSMTTDEGDISWVSGPGEATALIDGGRTAEIHLAKPAFGQAGKTPVIKDLAYRGAKGNSGFVLMPSTLEAYHVGAKPFEFKDTSGFMTTFDVYDQPQSMAGKSGE